MSIVSQVSQSHPFYPPRSVLTVRRHISNMLAIVLTTIFLLFTVGILLYLISYVLVQGLHFINLNFFTQVPTANGEPGGGMGQSVQGTLILVGLASLIGVPLGLFTGVYLSEFGRGRFAASIRLLVDILTGIPTIIFGLFAWGLIVVPNHSFSGFAGGVALGIIMVPIVARTSEDVLRLVSRETREASLALGATESHTILRVVIPSALNGIITGIILAMARVAGETAPLIMTAFGTTYWNADITQPTDALPLGIYNFSHSPYHEQVNQAYAGAFILIMLIFLTSFAVRWATKGFQQINR